MNIGGNDHIFVTGQYCLAERDDITGLVYSFNSTRAIYTPRLIFKRNIDLATIAVDTSVLEMVNHRFV